MERRIPLIAAALLFASAIFAEEVSQDLIIRFSVWSSIDAYPGLVPAEDSQQKADPEPQKQPETKSGSAESSGSSSQQPNFFDVPVSQLKKMAPFIVQGMAYGWKFDYTPSDKARNVEEYFEFTPVKELTDAEKKSIVYTKPWIKENRLWCWIEYSRNISMQQYYASWQTIGHPHIMGTGYGKLIDGFTGIEDACREALKNAVRQYERKVIKNKPKEIFGTVIVNDPPQIGLDAGRYVVTLDFFMETDRILQYKKF